MKLDYKIAELLDSLVVETPKTPYWIEIKTQNPECIYYFGHFDSSLAAKFMQNGYVKDLIAEKAIVESVKLKQCQPQQLTITKT